MMEWIGSHNVGISSKTMWCALMSVPCDRDDRPYDADDFSRCYDLYKFAELTQKKYAGNSFQIPILVTDRGALE